MRDQLQNLFDTSQRMYEELDGEAELPTVEPYLHMQLRMERTGRIRMSVEITPDQLTQQHSFIFEIDQSHLPPFLDDLRAALDRI
jgi:hypothetical protein